MVNARLLLACGLAAWASSGAARELSEADFLADLPTVLTASRLEQPVMDAPNAVTVIDRKLIESSGYHNVSDLFRLAPGMFVGQKKGWFHNVSHTFVDEYPHRMQVMVDGRSVYLPSIGGVRWDALPLSVDDIERIEVVRGPNAASYGANAFTGIINIITRHPADVAGRMLNLAVGDQTHQEAWFRWAGGARGAQQRVTLGWRKDGGFAAQYDDELTRMLTYRGDFTLDRRQEVSLQFGLLEGTRGEGEVLSVTSQPHAQDVSSQFFQFDHRFDPEPGRSLKTKLYMNRVLGRESVPTLLVAGTHYDVNLLSQRWHAETQYDSEIAPGVRTSLGTYLRRDTVRSQIYFNNRDSLDADSWGVFGQIEWRLSPQWLLNGGLFWEDYELVDRRLSPRVTLHWQPSARHAWRIGVSKAYRNPVLYETNGDYRIRLLDANGNLVATTRPFLVASGNVIPEQIVSQEIGYLGTWPEVGLSADLRVFKERVRDLISAECPTGNSLDCKTANPLYLARDWYNIGSADQRGAELQVKWQATEDTQILVNYAFLHIDSRFDERRYSPSHLSGLHLMRRFPGEVDLTLSHYWVSAFEPIGQGPLPSYKRLDARLAKRFTLSGQRAQVALTVENLTGDYLEFADDNPQNIFGRRAYVHFQVDF